METTKDLLWECEVKFLTPISYEFIFFVLREMSRFVKVTVVGRNWKLNFWLNLHLEISHYKYIEQNKLYNLMLRPSVSIVCSFVFVLAMKQKTVSLLLKSQRYTTYNAHEKCVILNSTNPTIDPLLAHLLILWLSIFL